MSSSEQEVLFAQLENKLDALSGVFARAGGEANLEHVLQDVETGTAVLSLGLMRACFDEKELTRLREEPFNSRLGYIQPATDGATSDCYSV